MLGVAAPLKPLGWTVIVEQPRSEAFQVADQLQRQLIFVILAGAAVHDRRSVISGAARSSGRFSR